MKVEEAKYSIAELIDWMKTKVLIVNNDYQRGGGLWPQAAKSYFIDTVLKEFPFPKVYFYERIDQKSKKPRREIVDGQQRLTTLLDFSEGKFALGKNAKGYEGLHFAELPPDIQDSYWTYTVAVDVIRNADRNEILQMFRRMNAFTLPLNEAEKRHSEFFGDFKDWVNQILDAYGSVLVDWEVLTNRQIVRMADAEFISDLALAAEQGVVSTSPAKLKALYKQYDQQFQNEESLSARVGGALEAVQEKLSGIQGTFAVKPHVFHSLLCALMHNRFGLPGVEATTGIEPQGEFVIDSEAAVEGVKMLAAAHEERDLSAFGDYVQACLEGGNRAPQRRIRLEWLSLAIRGELVA